MKPLSFRSSCSHLAYCFSSYHLEDQVLMIPRRKPVLWVFCPIRLSLVLLTVDDDGDVAGAVVDAVGPTHRARQPALDDRPAVDGAAGDHQLVDVLLPFVLGVGDGRDEQ